MSAKEELLEELNALLNDSLSSDTERVLKSRLTAQNLVQLISDLRGGGFKTQIDAAGNYEPVEENHAG